MKRVDVSALADSVRRRAQREAGGPVEVFVLQDASGSVRVEKNHVSGVETETTLGFGLRLVEKTRIGFAYFTKPEQVSDAVASARRSAALGRALKAFTFAGSGRAPRVSGVYDARLEAWSGPDAIAFAQAMVRQARAAGRDVVVTEAGVSFGTTRVAVSTSEGADRHHVESGMSASCFVVQRAQGVSTGFAGRDSTRLDVSPEALGTEAADLCLRARNPTRLERGGVLPLVLRPEPAADLLSTITLDSLVARAAHRRESYYSGKLGRRVAHAKLSVRDDPLEAGGLGSSPFDDEGEPSRSVDLIRNGVLRSFASDRATSAEFGAPVTASSLRVHPFDGRSHKSPPSAAPRNVRVDAPATSLERLVGSVDHGVLVHDLMGVHTANTVSGDFSVTSSVLFRIRKGAVEGPLAAASVSGNLHRELERGFRLADDLKRMGGETAVAMPSTLFSGLTVTP